VDVHIAAIEYALPERAASLDDLAREGRLGTSPEALRSFGFEQAWVAGSSADELAPRAVARVLEHTGIDPVSIDVLFYAGATPGSHAAGDSLLGGFSYPAARLQYDLGLVNARIVGVSQTGCLGLMTAVSLGRAFLTANQRVNRVLCVSVDVLPAGSRRDILYNLISDGACAVLLERGPGKNRLLTERQITKGYYWDCEALGNEIVAAYFPTARTIIRDTLVDAGLGRDQLAQIIPHNVSKRSWDILMQLTGLPQDRLYADNIATKGHVIGGDNFINLKDAESGGRLTTGDLVLLFNFGFGASWACLLIEH
jgi:3-oxoacyl-[acyl-carrier-protein] synthase III